jgi:hypothetical protein
MFLRGWLLHLLADMVSARVRPRVRAARERPGGCLLLSSSFV